MLSFIKDIPNILKRYFGNFLDCFTAKTQKAMQDYFVSLFLPHKRFSLQAVTNSKGLAPEYQKLQYAFSESNWEPAELNNLRLDYIMHSSATAPTNKGILAIDDTSVPKSRTAKHTEGAQVQYCGAVGGLANCNVFVYSGYADPGKHFLIDSEPYVPQAQCDKISPKVEFKSKIDFAKELIDKAIERRIPFSYICFDNWYLCKKVVGHIQKRNRCFISELAVNDKVSLGGCWIHADGLVKAIPPTKWKAVTVSGASNNSRHFRIASYTTKVKGLPGKYQIILAQEYNPTTEKCTGKLMTIVTDDLAANAEAVLHYYLLRWGIERCFEEAKDFCYLDQYQVRHLSKIKKHLSLAHLAHTFLYTARKLGSFSKSIGTILEVPAKKIKDLLHTFGDILRAVRALIVKKNQCYLAHDSTLPASVFLGL